jgi:hypothetical protein
MSKTSTFYNANEYGNGKDYKALGVMTGGTDPVDLGTAKYNTDTPTGWN